MTDRDKMVEIMANWHRMQYGTVPNYEVINKYADLLTKAGFSLVVQPNVKLWCGTLRNMRLWWMSRWAKETE